MKLQLWIINSFLILIFLLALLVSRFLEIEPPSLKVKAVSAEVAKPVEVKPVVAAQNWEKIYQEDVFGTYVEKVTPPPEKVPLVTPIPELKPIQFTVPPEPKMPAFVAPLNITLKGIIVTGDEQKSAAMVADETNKERMYYLGDKIKDAQIIKISRNRVVVLRANGQQESFYLIKDDLFLPSPDKWENIVKKISDQKYKIDPHAFKIEVESLGNFIERVGVLGTAYSNGKPVGVKIGDTKDRDVASSLGILQNDVVTAINGISIADVKDRMRLFDAISKMKVGDNITVNMLRAGNDVSVDYELAKFPRVSKAMAALTGKEPAKTGADALPLNQMQEREKRTREFAKRHGGDARDQNTVTDLRSRFLDNLREKLKNARNRAR
ncbi:MAG: type II secretion system protein N [bacterium]